MPFKTIEEKRAYQRKWCKEHPDHDRVKKARKKKRARDWIGGYKKGLACVRCGENDPACLDFHHIDHSKKEKWVSRLVGNGASIETIKKEIAQCVPLCGNCHRKLHYEERKNGRL